MQRIRNFVSNPVYAWLIVFILFGISSGYVWYNSPIPPSPNPDFPIPSVTGTEDKIQMGDNAYLSLMPYIDKPTYLEDLSVDWQVWCGTKKIVLHKTLEGNVFFPVGVEPNRKYDVFVTVTYLYHIKNNKEDRRLLKTFLLKYFVVVDGPPVPPTPPVPPEPVVSKLRVLFVVDKSVVAKLPPPQQEIFNLPKDLRDYLNSHCLVVANVPEWRIFDKDDDVSAESPAWQAGMNRYKSNSQSSLPWLVLVNETSDFAGPLPSNKGDLILLFQKYGGK